MGKIPKRINFSVRTRASTGADLRLRLPFPQNGTTQPREQNNDAAGQRRPPPTDPARGHEDPHLARRRRSDHAHARRRGRIRATYRRTEREVGREKPRTAGNRVPSFFRIFAATGSTDAIAVFSLSQFSSCFFFGRLRPIFLLCRRPAPTTTRDEIKLNPTQAQAQAQRTIDGRSAP